MIYTEFVESAGLHYMMAREPFSLDGLADALDKRRKIHAADIDKARVGFFDFRAIDFLHLGEPDWRRYILRRRAMEDPLSQIPAAVLVGSLGSLGMFRMYSILADLAELHTEDSLFPTTDLGEATAWLAKKDGRVEVGDLRTLIDAAAQKAAG